MENKWSVKDLYIHNIKAHIEQKILEEVLKLYEIKIEVLPPLSMQPIDLGMPVRYRITYQPKKQESPWGIRIPTFSEGFQIPTQEEGNNLG